MNKIIVVTGASRGIGRNIAYNLAIDGNIIIANYNNSQKEAEDLKKSLQEKNISIDIYKADISNSNEARALINYAIEKYGKINVLINNAGIDQEKLFTDITDQEFDFMMKTNLYSYFYTTQEAVKNMLKEQSGCIINISSIYAINGGPYETHYAMTKAAIDGMTKSLARELGASNIRVNSIAPGAIDTDMNSNLSEEDWKVVIEETPLKRKGEPIDITRCVKWLIEDEFTTGQVISPNGGLVIF